MSVPRKLITRSLPRLLSRAAFWRRRRQRLVFTNGVFDVLHAGHVQLLERARRLGDRLVVGVNTDASVRRIKGPRRPLNAWNDRAAVLAALESVDAVVAFAEDTPARLIAALRPDVLVKGADYPSDRIAGTKDAGRVVRVRLKKGYSTTALIREIMANNRR
ncbi:MAG: D-glycero-beta-D-manno-heptose 1-phosphate adenylyltransferase [Elusimicrobia bacterium]|nr:D-glycero-beta-D-manno-heptose 1-phosphate adenylyltransferase [Elusimicrobiota bacterium]